MDSQELNAQFVVNADLVNKIVNLTSRTVPMLHRHFDGNMGELDPDAKTMLQNVKEVAAGIRNGTYPTIEDAQAAFEEKTGEIIGQLLGGMGGGAPGMGGPPGMGGGFPGGGFPGGGN